jgi:hypothetical protein
MGLFNQYVLDLLDIVVLPSKNVDFEIFGKFIPISLFCMVANNVRMIKIVSRKPL